MLAITLDLSEPDGVVASLTDWLLALRKRVDDMRQELACTSAGSATAAAASGSAISSFVRSGLCLSMASTTVMRSKGRSKWKVASPYTTSVEPNTDCVSSRISSSVRSMASR